MAPGHDGLSGSGPFEAARRAIAEAGREQDCWPGALLNVVTALAHVAEELASFSPDDDLGELEARVFRIFFAAAATAARDAQGDGGGFADLGFDVRTAYQNLVSSLKRSGA